MESESLLDNIEVVKNSVIEMLQGTKQSVQLTTFETLPDFMTEFLPKKSKVMGRRFQKDILGIKDPRLLVVSGHLYLENFMDGIINEKFSKPKYILNFSFYNKLKILDSQELLSILLIKDIGLVNKLRNKYVHHLEYDLLDFELSEFSDLKNIVKHISFRRKNDIRKCYIYLLRLQFLFIVDRLSVEHNSVYFL